MFYDLIENIPSKRIDDFNNRNMATTYTIHNSLNNSVIVEYWDDIPVRKTCISQHYRGGNIVQFLEEHKLHVVSKVEYIENMIKWLKGGVDL